MNDERKPNVDSPKLESMEGISNKLKSLNERLAVYIDFVKKNEIEKINDLVYSSRNVSQMKALYERELDNKRSLINELDRQNAKLQMQINLFKMINQNINTKEYLDESLIKYDEQTLLLVDLKNKNHNLNEHLQFKYTIHEEV
jgi:hypothetical protein